MRLCRASAAALFGAFLLSASPAFSNPLVAPAAQEAEAVFRSRPDGALEHVASGFVFPKELALLRFGGEHVYAADNVSARYGSTSSEDGQPWLDLYIYPAQGTLEDEAAQVGQIIIDRYSAMPIDGTRTPPPIAADGRSQWYAATIGELKITTGYVLVRRAGWSMKVRASTPANAGGAGLEQLLDAIAAVRWDWAPAKSPPGEIPVVASR